MNSNQHFKMPTTARITSLVLMLVGIVAIIGGAVAYSNSDPARFWSTILQDSIFALLISVASMFILTATTLAQGGWIVSLRRVPEAIASIVWILGIIVCIVLMILVWGNHTEIYPWLKEGYIPHTKLNSLKNFFLNKTFFTVWTLIVLVGWGFFGYKFRALSLEEDTMKPGVTSQMWRTNKWAAGFAFLFALSLASTIPWLWIMSIDAHWFSTMFSWYTFASSFVTGMSMIMLFTLYLRRNGALPFVTEEHIHDLGKFMFAFSVFWTYLWFSQFMLIWYANIPEETVYFQPRFHGPYRIFFWLNLILNFVSPILILMSRPAKRNYFIVSLVAVLIFIGHWVDFYQMIHPGTEGLIWHVGLFEICTPLFFAGVIIYGVLHQFSKAPAVPQNHPYLKESIIHFT